MRLFESLINLEVSWNQPEELTQKVSSKMDLDQHMQLIEEEDRRNILMIGGIEIFLPFSKEEAGSCVAEEAMTTKERQPAETVRENEFEQVSETAQEGEEEDEHSEECLNDFS
jgi:hypothetical protein